MPMWQEQDVVLSLWLTVKNKTGMADAKTLHQCIHYLACDISAYMFACETNNEAQTFCCSWIRWKLTKQQCLGRFWTRSAENTDRRHVTESISNDKHVFSTLNGEKKETPCWPLHGNKPSLATRFTCTRRWYAFASWHKCIKTSASLTVAGCVFRLKDRFNI